MSCRPVLNFRRASVGAIVAGSMLLSASAEEGSTQFLDSIREHTSAVFSKCRSAVVRIEGTDEHGRISGTGFFIDPNGTVVTCYSIGGEASELTVTVGQQRLPAARLIADHRSGVAILKIEAQTPFLPMGNSRDLKLASPVMVVGYPMDLRVTPSFGLVGGFDVKYMGRSFAAMHIRANLPVQRGQGGAPLLNLKGEAVGVLISSIDEGSAAFALPIEAAEKVRRDFLRFHKVRPGWLGIQVGPIDHPERDSTAEVKDLLPDSPGWKAGVRIGDVLLQVGDRKITSPDEVRDAAFYLTADDDVTLRISRDEEELEFQARPIDPPGYVPALPRLAPENSLRLQSGPSQ